MKKAIFMGIIFLFIAFGSSAYMSYLATGKYTLPFATFFENKKPNEVLANIKDAASTAKENITGDNIRQVYKWKDKNGQWQFGDKPPVDTAKAELIDINKNQNIIDAVKIPEPESKLSAPATIKPVTKPNPYSPSQVKQTIDDAKNVQNLLNERLKQQEKALQKY